jgi:homoserine kinase
VPDRVVVRAPATIANLGPGFDCLGLALAWHNEVRVERDPSGELTVTVAGEGAEQIPRDGTNLVVRALARALGTDRGFRVHCTNAIPFGRGFGSSAAAIVAGLVAGYALDAGGATRERLVLTASELEGHADNVAPCVHGGAVVVAGGATQPLGSPATIKVIACVAPSSVPTAAARKALPERVAFADAAANAGRAAMAAAVLAQDLPNHLLEATEDVVHQPARFALMPDSGLLVGKLRDAGVAAFLAGAGPSVAAFVPAGPDEVAEAEAVARRAAPDGWDVRSVPIDPVGAMVVEGAPTLT